MRERKDDEEKFEGIGIDGGKKIENENGKEV